MTQHGLLKKRHPGTVYEWVHRWEVEGIGGADTRQALLLVTRRGPLVVVD